MKGNRSQVEELCVVGRRLGGADTELDHQIYCWQAMGVEVHLCHTGELDDNLREMRMQDRGCVYHAPRDWPSLEGMHCISYCNGDFLESLPEIKRYARSTTFVNCMTWNFEQEVRMQQRGLIDYHLFQTEHGLRRPASLIVGMTFCGFPLRSGTGTPLHRC